VARARSLALDRSLPLTREGQLTRIVLPRLDEGDILLLE